MSHINDLPAITSLGPEPINDSNNNMANKRDRSSISTAQINPKQRSKWYQCIMGDIYATDDPNDYSQRKKNIIILLVALGGIAGPMSSMMYMPGLLAVARDLNTTTSAVNGTISAFVVFMGISVSLFISVSET
jgi:hypothetical protein